MNYEDVVSEPPSLTHSYYHNSPNVHPRDKTVHHTGLDQDHCTTLLHLSVCLTLHLHELEHINDIHVYIHNKQQRSKVKYMYTVVPCWSESACLLTRALIAGYMILEEEASSPATHINHLVVQTPYINNCTACSIRPIIMVYLWPNHLMSKANINVYNSSLITVHSSLCYTPITCAITEDIHSVAMNADTWDKLKPITYKEIFCLRAIIQRLCL